MRIHEYQAKQILEDFGVPVPPGKVATDPAEAAEVFESLPGDAAVVKAQSYGDTPEGGRGVGLARSADEAAALARGMIGKRFGRDRLWQRPVTKLLIEQYVAPESTLYLAVVMDSGLVKPVMLASARVPEHAAGVIPAGGVSREVIDPRFGTLSFQWRKVAAALGLDRSMLAEVTAVASGLYRAFIECECIEAEIGQLGVTGGGGLLALAARMRFDDSALFRHDEIASLRDPAEFGETENRFDAQRMRYVSLDGRIGCVVFDTGSAQVMLDDLSGAGARPGGLLYLSGAEPAEKVAYGVTNLLREEAFRAVVVEVPRARARAEQVVSGVRLALAGRETDKPVVVLADSGPAFKAAGPLGDLAGVRVVRSGADAAAAVGRD